MTSPPVAFAVAALTFIAACSSSAPEPRRAAPSPYSSLFPSRPEDPPLPAKTWFESGCDLPLEYVRRTLRGYKPGRSPDVVMIPRAPNFFGSFTTTSHSGPWGYVQRVPLVLYGPGFVKAQGDLSLDREVTVADLAPTLAELLGISMPDGIDGRPLTEALLPEAERAGTPKLIMVVVWDGGGWDVLDTWPGAWPFLARLMEEGTSVQDAVVGSSPSVTPAVHATIGTGTFPSRHGIVDIPVRNGQAVVGSYQGRTPKFLDVPTLADLHDLSTQNRSKVAMVAYKSWHLGMIGHGAYSEGGDRDIAVIAERTQGHLVTNPLWYELPSYVQKVPGFDKDVRTVDLSDGMLDQRWEGHEMLDDPTELRHTPVWALYQTRIIKALMRNEGFGQDQIPDLFYTNYKQIDEVGHDWNMLNPEMQSILSYSDTELEDLVDFMNENVGENGWVLAVTADHGQSPEPERVGAWPVRMTVLVESIADHFGVSVGELFQDSRPLHLWLNRATMARANITPRDIADYLIDYRIKDNTRPGEDLPDQYDSRLGEPVFAAAFPAKALPRIFRCAQARGGT